MYIWACLTALVAAAAGLAVDTADTLQERGLGSFTIHQVALNSTRHRSVAIAIERVIEKFSSDGKVPDNIRAAAEAARQGTVTAQNLAFDQAYVSPVKIGTPAQLVNLDIDTGSSDLWVYSAQSPANERQGHSIYSPGKSSTSRKVSGARWSIVYGDGTKASGDVYKDVVNVGGVTVSNQGVEAATQVSRGLTREKNIDGIFGFAFPKLNTVRPQKQNPWIINAGPKLNKNLFAAALKHGMPGFYNFGFIDSSAYTGSIAYAPVTNTGFWSHSVGGYYVGATRYNKGYTLVSDTGTSLIFVPVSVARKYYAQVPGARQDPETGIIYFPCKSKLPDFGLMIGGQKRTIPGSFVNYAPINARFCEGGIQLTPPRTPNILGDVFLKGQYVVYDVGNKRAGYAQAA